MSEAPAVGAIQASLRASVGSRAHRVGPFLLTYDPDTDNPGRNYAIPDDGARPTAADVDALCERFAQLGRLPRLEYLAPAPAVDAALRAAGFAFDHAFPVLISEPDRVVPPPVPAGVTVRAAGSDADLRGAADVAHVAYGGPPGPTPDADVRRLRRTVDAGGGVAVALADGAYVGSGLFVPPSGGLTEIAAVGVLAGYRRRGIASAVSHRLTADALAAGARPFLQAEGESEARLYERLGYRRVSVLVAPARSGARTN
jgi:ribosomal protein S18 acetylase RimI-like enzyme